MELGNSPTPVVFIEARGGNFELGDYVVKYCIWYIRWALRNLTAKRVTFELCEETEVVPHWLDFSSPRSSKLRLRH